MCVCVCMYIYRPGGGRDAGWADVTSRARVAWAGRGRGVVQGAHDRGDDGVGGTRRASVFGYTFSKVLCIVT
jgi:hypothetical protein